MGCHRMGVGRWGRDLTADSGDSKKVHEKEGISLPVALVRFKS